MQILITGASGQVGGELLRLFPAALAPGRAELDLAEPACIRAFLRTHRPALILNPAAFTAVDQAESQPELASAINTEAPAVLGQEAASLGASVLHFSTDYVFDGRGTEPYRETDAAAPQSVYGRTKLAGEQALAASGARFAILRTSWVYGPTGKNFLRTILRVAAERPEMRIVADQHGAPTSAAELARVAAAIVQADPELRGGGILHATGAGETTWHGFAAEIVGLARARWPGKQWARLEAIQTEDYPTPARRPANSRLNCDRLAESYGLRMPDWRTTLAEIMAAMPEAS